ncbi:MAG: ATP-binding protein [Armatimonadota bacterium]
MSNAAELKSLLKALKLSDILDHLDVRLLEAQHNELSFSELLAMILTDEMEARRNRKFQRLLKRAHLDPGKTLASFDFSFNPSINALHLRELATCQFIERAENVFLLGPTGTGKTHLAQALSHMACRQHLVVDFYSFHALFTTMTHADLAGTVDRLIGSLIKSDLLVVDDFAFKKVDQKTAEWFYTIVDGRYALRSIILTSKRALSDWAAIFPDKVMANAVLDRLAHNAHQIVIKGESFRKKKPPQYESA